MAAAVGKRSAGSFAMAVVTRSRTGGGTSAGKRRRIVAEVMHRHGDRVVTEERRASGQALVRDGAERVDVGRRPDGLFGYLFRGDVKRRADDLAGAGQVDGLRRSGHPEVDEHDGPIRLHDEVSWLDVAVDDLGGVRGVQRARRLGDDRDGLRGVEPTGGGDPLVEWLPIDVSHDEVRAVMVTSLSVVVHLGHARVVERGHAAGLVQKPGLKQGVPGLARVQHLDRDTAPEHRVGP